MPLVQVFYDSTRISGDYLKQLRDTLPKNVAKQLTCDEAVKVLTLADITVIFNPYGPFDVQEKPLAIIITANFFFSRKENLDERAKQIARDIHETNSGNVLPDDYFVWIVLGYGGYWSSD